MGSSGWPIVTGASTSSRCTLTWSPAPYDDDHVTYVRSLWIGYGMAKNGSKKLAGTGLPSWKAGMKDERANVTSSLFLQASLDSVRTLTFSALPSAVMFARTQII